MEFKLNKEQSLWYSEKDGKNIAYAEIKKQTDGSYIITRIYVDPELRGQGIASKIMASFTLFAIDNKLKFAATCSYAEAWMLKHPENSSVYL